MERLEHGVLVSTLDELEELLEPVKDGRVEFAAADTETSLVSDRRFTPYGTDTRIAGFSVSYDLAEPVDLYVPIRHVPYDWRRRIDLIRGDTEHDGPAWVERLERVEFVRGPEDDAPGWQPGKDPNLDPAAALGLLANVLGTTTCRWAWHNLAFDAKQLAVEGIPLDWERMEDTQLLSVFTDERPQDAWDEDSSRWVHQGHALKHLGERYLDIPADAQTLLEQAKAALGAGSAKLQDYSMLPMRTAVAPYACMDTRLVMGLYRLMMLRDAAKDPKVMALYHQHVHEVRHSTAMEAGGIQVRTELVPEVVEQKQKEADAILVRLNKVAGEFLPVNNGEALAKVLYGELKFPTYRGLQNTKKATLKQVRAHLAAGTSVMGAGSTLTADQAVDVLDDILDYRKQFKLLTAFYRPLAGFSETGAVHPVLQPCAARTTRYSASAPNMQQQPKPKKGKEDESPRRLFVPRDGHSFTTLDYSQVELRLAAHYSVAIPATFEYQFSWKCTLERRGDCKGRGKHGSGEVHYGWRKNFSHRGETVLFNGFMSGDPDYDPHQRMADVSGRPRDLAKNGNFALLYGAFPNKLAETLDIPVFESRKLFDQFWDDAYPELGHLRKFVDERLRKGGKQTTWSHQEYLRTLYGARIHLEGGYKGLNYLIQRSAREILLKAINAVGEYLEQEVPSYRMVLPVHDELILEHPKDELDQEIIQHVAKLMVLAGGACRVPMLVGPDLCEEDWAHKQPLEGWGWNGVLGESL